MGAGTHAASAQCSPLFCEPGILLENLVRHWLILEPGVLVQDRLDSETLYIWDRCGQGVRTSLSEGLYPGTAFHKTTLIE